MRMLFSLKRGWVWAIGAIFLSSAFAKTPVQTEIKVKLFGQPCALQGPFDTETLHNVHSVSPEQIYPSTNEVSADQIKKSIERLHSVALPSALDRYKDKLGRRLEAQAAYFSGLQQYRLTHKSAGVTAAAKKYFVSHRAKDLEGFEKKLASIPAKEVAQGGENLDQLTEAYNESIEADPEEDFHRAIEKLGIRYACSFEESGEGSDDHAHSE